ncbi:MAG: hypothetical protein ACXQT5_08610 [Candidatus Syntropharchaeia archaeon]
MVESESKRFVTAFTIGAIEINRTMGTHILYDWLRAIGERMGEMDGGGIEGERHNDLSYHPICLFITQLESSRYRELFSKEGRDLAKILENVDARDRAASPDIICITHHAYMKKRAELAGKKFFHLAAKSHLTNESIFNDGAIKEVGKKKREIEKLMENAACVFMYR